MPKKRSFMLHFEITPACMTAGIKDTGRFGKPDVFDNLATKMRNNPEVRAMVKRVEDGELDKVLVGVGREIEVPDSQSNLGVGDTQGNRNRVLGEDA